MGACCRATLAGRVLSWRVVLGGRRWWLGKLERDPSSPRLRSPQVRCWRFRAVATAMPCSCCPDWAATTLRLHHCAGSSARLGYRSYGWGLGANRGFGRHVTDGLDELLTAAHETGPVSLVGWSLGGVHAIELARRRPDAVRSIITLGTPLVGRRDPPAGIPTTSVYSRTDAIVSWRASLLAPRSLHENVEVRGSHLGLGHNPAVAVVVADRLAQQHERWQPFQPPRWARRWLPAA